MVTLSDQFGGPRFTKGGQGKFFSDPKPVDEHRYQRGYTPERMNDVRQARMMVTAGQEGSGPFTGPAGEQQVHEVIARSKTPMREINIPKTAYGTDRDPDDVFPLHIETGLKGNLSGRSTAAAGTYSGGGMYERGNIRIAGGAVGNYGGAEGAGQTLLHELGHYRSAKVEHNDSAHYRTPGQVGKEEAFADDNEKERWRPDPRDVRKGISKPPRGAYENSGAFNGLGGKKAHGPYVRARKTLNPEEKKTILEHGFRPMGRSKPEPFTHEVTGEHYSHTGVGRDWHVQGNLYAAENEKLFNDRREASLKPAMTHAEARAAGHAPLVHF